MIKRPMLAGRVDPKLGLSDLSYPLMASPKIDGIRALHVHGLGAVARSLKPLPNKHIRELISKLPPGLDGEVISCDPDGTLHEFNTVQSKVMSRDGEPRFQYWVFDFFGDPQAPFASRYKEAKRMVAEARKKGLGFVCLVEHVEITDAKSLEDYEAAQLAAGYEGVMIRDPQGPYKSGRSTYGEGWLLKIKRFEDAEGVIIGFEAQMHNQNEKTKNELGLSKRSSHKAGKVERDTLGKLIVQTEFGELRIGTGEGLTLELRERIWKNQAAYKGKTITYVFQRHGMKDKPRLPIFKGFRDTIDL